MILVAESSVSTEPWYKFVLALTVYGKLTYQAFDIISTEQKARAAIADATQPRDCDWI